MSSVCFVTQVLSTLKDKAPRRCEGPVGEGRLQSQCDIGGGVFAAAGLLMFDTGCAGVDCWADEYVLELLPACIPVSVAD